MKRILHWLVRFYPKGWRERYEAEFHDVLDDIRPQWKDVFDVLRGGIVMQPISGVVVKAVSFGFVTALVVVLLFWLMPAPFESQAIISTRTVNVGVPVGPEDMRRLSQRALSRDNLVKIVEGSNLYPELRANGRNEKVLERARGDIGISIQFPNPSLALTYVSFRHPDPNVAIRVNRSLVTLFMDENVRQIAEQETAHRTAFGHSGAEELGPIVELLSPATEGRHPPSPKAATVFGVTLAEGSQIYAIIALLRLRALPLKAARRA